MMIGNLRPTNQGGQQGYQGNGMPYAYPPQNQGGYYPPPPPQGGFGFNQQGQGQGQGQGQYAPSAAAQAQAERDAVEQGAWNGSAPGYSVGEGGAKDESTLIYLLIVHCVRMV